MLNLAEYRKRPASLADWLPWAGLVAPGVVLNKDGGFQRSARFRGPDLASASEAELVAVAARLNNALKRLGSGWALFVEAERRAAAPYPAAEFAEPLAWLVDEERRAAFDAAGELFESAYTLTVVYLPPEEARARAGALLFENTEPRQADWRGQLARYVDQTERISDLLEGLLPEFAWLGDGETVTYLHGTVSTGRHPVAVPEVPIHLDALLADAPLVTGLKPQLGAAHLRTLTVRGFPSATWPGLLDELNHLAFPYRWGVRFLCLDKDAAERELAKRRRQWFAKRKGIVTLLRETLFREESPLVDSDAANKALDADAALQDLGSDAVGFGWLTATVTVWDEDAEVAEARLRAAERVIQARGFVTIPESLNAVEAWLSSIPGQVYANVRTPVVSTLNLAHLMPLSAVWAGPERNAHLDGPPLLITRTEGATPFRLSTHVGDVGHALVVGPTGAGKSVLLALLVLQFRKYPGAQVTVFDKGGSIRATMLGLGGAWHDLGFSGGPAFQPLRGIDDPATLAWAAGWIEGLLAQQGVGLEPPVKDAVWTGLSSLASAPPEERTLTGLSILLASARLRQALAPYTVAGPYGRLLDAEAESWSPEPIAAKRARVADQDGRPRQDPGAQPGSPEPGSAPSDLQAFEMEALMRHPALAAAVLAYLFHRLERGFCGAPGLLVLDEAWLFLDSPLFAARLRDWLKTLRKKNVAVVFATQSLADIQASAIAPSIVESCPTRIFLPAPQALEPQLRALYTGFGLNGRQIEILAQARPKRDYYLASPLGNRLFELGLGEVALAFAGASTPADHAAMDELVASAAGATFAPAWLRRRGLAWAAELIDPQPPASEET